jgi:hypothetical protein
MAQEQGTKHQRSFTHKGINEKLNLLENRFGIAPRHPDYLSSIHQARNCLTHRSGRVGEEDCPGRDDFTIKWRSFDYLAKEPGKDDPIPLAMPYMELEQGTRILLRPAVRELTMKKGEVIRLSPKQLAEICHFITIAVDEVCEGTAEYARMLGALEKT